MRKITAHYFKLTLESFSLYDLTRLHLYFTNGVKVSWCRDFKHGVVWFGVQNFILKVGKVEKVRS